MRSLEAISNLRTSAANFRRIKIKNTFSEIFNAENAFQERQSYFRDLDSQSLTPVVSQDSLSETVIFQENEPTFEPQRFLSRENKTEQSINESAVLMRHSAGFANYSVKIERNSKINMDFLPPMTAVENKSMDNDLGLDIGNETAEENNLPKLNTTFSLEDMSSVFANFKNRHRLKVEIYMGLTKDGPSWGNLTRSRILNHFKPQWPTICRGVSVSTGEIVGVFLVKIPTIL